jgi:aromatic ring-opening dioxygenase LigB subunit
MPLVLAAIAPHGFPIIPDLSDDAEGGLATCAAMEGLGRRAAAAGIEALVIAGPHGVRVDGANCLADTARAAGTLAWQGREVELNIPLDGALTDAIAAAARARDIPIAMAGYAGNRRYQSVLPMDWGVLTSLWFLGHGCDMPGHGNVLAEPPAEDIGPPAVIITPSRSLPRETLVEFGRAVAGAAADLRRIAFIAACDWGHTHGADGPYGFHEEAAKVDAEIVAAVEANDLMRPLDLEESRARAAAIDGLWQTLILAGALEAFPMRSELLSYEAPTYLGMSVAAWEPEGDPGPLRRLTPPFNAVVGAAAVAGHLTAKPVARDAANVARVACRAAMGVASADTPGLLAATLLVGLTGCSQRARFAPLLLVALPGRRRMLCAQPGRSDEQTDDRPATIDPGAKARRQTIELVLVHG